MKKTLFLSVILLFTFAGCKLDDSVISPTSPNGKALLKFDPSTIHEGITLITAVLTRQGFNTVSGNLNILNDSTAEISFQNLAVGMWHLLVQAKDSVGMVRFSGEADVNILENQLTQVNLTLVPTGTGTGSIHIVVNWGTQLSQWFQQNSGTTLQLRDVFFINENIGWIVGAQGKVIKTTNGGNNWQNVSLNTSTSLSSIWFVSSEIGFIVGGNGTVYKTTDGGLNWSSSTLEFGVNLYEVQFYNNESGFITGEGGIVYKTTNLGSSWITQYTSTYASLYALKVLSSQTIFYSWTIWNN